MTRPDLKMFGLSRENVFLKLPILYSPIHGSSDYCKTAEHPMDVDNITDVAERVHHELIGGISRSDLPWFRRVVKFPLCTCGHLGPGPRSLDPMLVRDYQRLKNTLILNTQLEVSCSYQFAHACMASFQVALGFVA